MYIRLAWRNLWRNRNRTLITMASVYFAVILTVLIDSLQTGVFDNLIKNVVSFYSGYIQVHKKGYWDEPTLENSFIANDTLFSSLKNNPAVIETTPRIEIFAFAAYGKNTRICRVVGILPANESEVIQLQKRLVKGEYLNDDDKSVLIGDGLAEKLQVKLNDTISLIGQGYHGANAVGKYPVKGLLHFGSPELSDRFLFIPLVEAQYMMDAPSVITSVILSLENPNKLNEVKKALLSSVNNSYEVMTWEEMMPEMVEHIKTDKGSGFIITLILYLLVSFGIFSTLLMMMAERRFEIGMLMAVGMKKRQLSLLLLLESFFVTVSGCIIGMLTSIPIVTYLKYHPIRFGGDIEKIYKKFGFEPIFPTSTDPAIFLKQTGLILTVSLVLSLYLVYKIYSMDPVSSMKK